MQMSVGFDCRRQPRPERSSRGRSEEAEKQLQRRSIVLERTYIYIYKYKYLVHHKFFVSLTFNYYIYI